MPHASRTRRSTTNRYRNVADLATGQLPAIHGQPAQGWYGERATAENGGGYDSCRKIIGDHSHYADVRRDEEGKIKGFFAMGRTPPSAARTPRTSGGAGEAEWLVVRDLYETETASFWKDSPEVRPRRAARSTEVFFLPAAAAAEMDGASPTRSACPVAREGRGPARRRPLRPLVHLPPGAPAQEVYPGATLERDRPILALTWDYPAEKPRSRTEPAAPPGDQRTFAWRRRPVNGFGDLRDDGRRPADPGSTAASFRKGDLRRGAARQARRVPNHSQWGWAWPNNRRILYNRASADPDGQPWSERKRLVWWDREQRKWTGYDTPDFPRDKAPDTPANPDAFGIDAHTGADPFIMNGDGRAWLYAPSGLKDGPLPAHYEPFKSPVANALYPEWQNNPCVVTFKRRDNPMHGRENPRYPYIITTYRLTEHHTSGAMSRWNSWLSELQPALFCEIDARLAQEKGVANGDWVTITTSRSSIEARALVTDRVQPLRIGKRQVHVIGLPYHFGPSGLVTGDVANDLIGVALDPNVRIHEAKAFTCDLRKGRKSDQRPEAETPR